MTGFDTAIVKGGSRRAFAESFQPPVSVQPVFQWARRGWVPPQRALEIERLHGVDRALLVKSGLEVLLDDQSGGRRGQEAQS